MKKLQRLAPPTYIRCELVKYIICSPKYRGSRASLCGLRFWLLAASKRRARNALL